MAGVRLLSLEQSHELSSEASEDSERFLDTCDPKDDLTEYDLNEREFASKLAWLSRPGSKSNTVIHRKRLGVAVIALIIVGLVCASGLLFHSFSQPEEFHSKLPKLRPHDRELECTTWSKESIAQASEQWAPHIPPNSTSYNAGYASREWKKPSGFKIVALVFYGRREYVDILDCYLQQNLVSNGGYLDQVLFVANAVDPKDYLYLDELVETAAEYKRIEVPKRCEGRLSWSACLWSLAADRNTMYLKIDDDVVYFHPDTIPSIVESRIRHENPFVIGANTINVRPTAPMHYHNGAIHPYLPEPNVDKVTWRKISWRSSELKSYPSRNAKKLKNSDQVFQIKPPFGGHRWLPLRDSWTDLKKTPISHIEHSNGDSAKNYAVAKAWATDAQQQYSLLENIETGQLDKYLVGRDDHLWYTQFERYNINFIAVWGADIAENLPFDNHTTPGWDEVMLSKVLPQRLDRPVTIDSRALAVHFSFHTQRKVGRTDLLDRWRAYANERICHKMKKPLGPPCHGVE